MANHLSSTSLISQLNCDVCNNPLSYFPIYLTKDGNICGRCPIDKNAIKNNVYEKLVACLDFPCRYQNQGCFKELLPKDVAEHEKHCSFRLIKCTLLTCDWEGVFCGLISHCEEEHSKLILKENQDFDIDLTSSDEINFLIYDDKLLIVSWKFDNERKKLECLITLHQEENLEKHEYSCELSLKYAKRRYSTKFETDTIAKISYFELLEENLGVLKVTGFLSFRPALQDQCQTFKEMVYMNMLSELKCCKCNEYVCPPIYASPDGKKYCKYCRSQSFPPNVALNSLANLIEYPCSNKKRGCMFTALPSLIQKHQNECQYGIAYCVFVKCNWQDSLINLKPHIDEIHNFEPNGTIFYFDISRNIHILFREWIKFGNCYFEVLFTMDDTHLYWIIQSIKGASRKFKYEIKIIDHNKNGDRLIVRKSCSTFGDRLIVKKSCSTFDTRTIYNSSNMLECDDGWSIAKNQVNDFTKKGEEMEAILYFKVTLFHDF